jgi:hypothetical protein
MDDLTTDLPRMEQATVVEAHPPGAVVPPEQQVTFRGAGVVVPPQRPGLVPAVAGVVRADPQRAGERTGDARAQITDLAFDRPFADELVRSDHAANAS